MMVGRLDEKLKIFCVPCGRSLLAGDLLMDGLGWRSDEAEDGPILRYRDGTYPSKKAGAAFGVVSDEGCGDHIIRLLLHYVLLM